MSDEANPLRIWRNGLQLSQERVCEMFAEKGFPKPSTAKLSRIERKQEIPLDMLSAIEAITGIPAKELRPEVAKIFDEAAQ